MNGYIYIITNMVIKVLKKINIVEYWKNIYPSPNSKKIISEKNEAIDWYIFFKWLLVFYFWGYNIDKFYSLLVVYYLLIMNIFTYFYYHIWNNRGTTSLERDRRRFINLILSILYSNFCFAYLYKFYYLNEFLWANNLSINLQVFAYGFSGIFGGGFLEISAKTDKGLLFSIFHSFINFLFIAVVLSNTNVKENVDNKI